MKCSLAIKKLSHQGVHKNSQFVNFWAIFKSAAQLSIFGPFWAVFIVFWGSSYIRSVNIRGFCYRMASFISAVFIHITKTVKTQGR